MKIAFDEHVPPGIVRVLQNLVDEGLIEGVEICSAKDYAPANWTPEMGEKSDVPWLRRFAKDGGQVVITGDKRMRTKPHERLALGGFVAFMFHPRWNHLDALERSAVLMHWWNRIVETAQQSKPGSFWEIPYSWSAGELVDVEKRRRSRRK